MTRQPTKPYIRIRMANHVQDGLPLPVTNRATQLPDIDRLRPDIQFATHQCSKFSIDPKHSHEVAAKRIVRYLKRTADKGILVTPDIDKGFECYVDADFAGTFTHAEADDPSSCLSHTGYVIMYANCPILWSSKMQSIITLSTTEAGVCCTLYCLKRCDLHSPTNNRDEILRLQRANPRTT